MKWRRRAKTAPLAAPEPIAAPECHREAVKTPRVPRWRVAWPSGTGTLWADHDDEGAAIADAERIVAGGVKTVCVYEIQSIESVEGDEAA